MSGDLIETLNQGEWWQTVVRGSNPASFTTDLTHVARAAATRLAALEQERDRLIALLDFWEKWEADVILDGAAWEVVSGGFAVVGQHYDRFIDLQVARAAARATLKTQETNDVG